MDVFWTLPPISRTVAAASFVVSVLGYNDLLPLLRFIFLPAKLLKIPPEVWRVFSSFLITGPGLSIILNPYFFYTYSSQLEKSSPRFTHPADFVVYLVFCGTIIIALAGVLLGGVSFLSPLTLAAAATFAQENPTMQVSAFILHVPGKYLPFLMLAITFVLGGIWPTMFQATGLVAAHLYDFLTRIWPELGGGTNPIFTPAWLQRLFGYEPRQRGAGTAYPARPDRGGGGGDGRGGSSSGNDWRTRGQGRRLG